MLPLLCKLLEILDIYIFQYQAYFTTYILLCIHSSTYVDSDLKKKVFITKTFDRFFILIIKTKSTYVRTYVGMCVECRGAELGGSCSPLPCFGDLSSKFWEFLKIHFSLFTIAPLKKFVSANPGRM